MKLYRTTIVIWSTFDGSTVEIDRLAQEAMTGSAFCSMQDSVLVDDPASDINGPDMDFFRDPSDLEE